MSVRGLIYFLAAVKIVLLVNPLLKLNSSFIGFLRSFDNYGLLIAAGTLFVIEHSKNSDRKQKKTSASSKLLPIFLLIAVAMVAFIIQKGLIKLPF